MATNTIVSALTLGEQMKRRYNGNILNAAMVLAERNEIVMDAPLVEANDVFTNVSSKWSRLPTINPRTINAGAEEEHGEMEQVRESIMLLENQVKIDERAIKHEPNPQLSWMREIEMQMEAVSQWSAYYFIYGDPGTDPRQCFGWATRRGTLGTNCVGLGGSGGDTTSVFLVEYDPLWNALIYPRGAQSFGFEFNDKGEQRVYDASNKPYFAQVYQSVVLLGTMVIDERSLQRITNIETTGATNNFIDSTEVRFLVQAVNRLPSSGNGATFLYANRTTKAQFDIYALEKANGFYTLPNITGRPISTFQGIPIKMVEQISDAETAVS